MDNKRRKKILFNIYSNNFKYIIDNSSLKKTFDKGYGCYCPICLNYFNEEESNSKENPLTFDHNPPKSLGGKNGVLTCKNCNSKAGYKIDKEILVTLLEIDFMNFRPNSELRTKLFNDSTKGKGVNANVKIDKKGEFIIDINSKNNNPIIQEELINSFEYSYTSSLLTSSNEIISSKLSFDFNKPNKRNEKSASISLLKIAYLMAFEKLGHIILFSKNMEIVRNQIKNPEKDIIKNPFWINFKFPDNMLGVNIITKPKELRSFLIVYDLKTKSDTYRVAICLPGYSSGDINIYKNIENLLCRDKGFQNIEVNSYLNIHSDIRDVKKALLPIKYWESLFEKPNL